MIKIELTTMGNFPHLQQIFSGLNILSLKGLCDVKITPPRHLGNINENTHFLCKKINANKPLCFLCIDGVKAVIDTLDGYNFDDKSGLDANLLIMDEIANGVDFYFKRSFSSQLNVRLLNKEKIYPLGFNYQVNDRRKNVQKKVEKKTLKSFVYDLLPIGQSLVIDDFEQYPNFTCDEDVSVLFMTRLWETDAKRKEINEQREEINEMRVRTIKELKKKLGNRFFGGLFPNKKSKMHPDLVLSRYETLKVNYINRLKSSTICIATTGLHDSIGWKMAEYVAASKCIVSEPLRYELPGNFNAGENYLEYTDARTLLLAVDKLMNDSVLRFNMQMNNYKYYNHYLRPDSLMLNVISTVKNNV